MAQPLHADSYWKTCLRPKQVEVARMLCPRQHLLPSRLCSKYLINGDQEESFNNSKESETNLALDILAVLRKKGPGSFDKFCDILLEIKDSTLIEVERSLRSYRYSAEIRHSAEQSRSQVAAHQHFYQEGETRSSQRGRVLLFASSLAVQFDKYYTEYYITSLLLHVNNDDTTCHK